MRQIDSMTPQEIETLEIKGMTADNKASRYLGRNMNLTCSEGCTIGTPLRSFSVHGDPQPARTETGKAIRKFAYYEESNDPSNYANPLFITKYPDGSTMSTMQESVAREAVNKFNSTIPNLCQTQPKQSCEERKGDSSKITENLSAKGVEHTTQLIESDALRNTRSVERRPRVKQARNSDTQSGQERSSNPIHAQNVEMSDGPTATIRTIQDLLTLNGSAQFATVALTESTEKLIVASVNHAPGLAEALREMIREAGPDSNAIRCERATRQAMTILAAYDKAKGDQ